MEQFSPLWLTGFGCGVASGSLWLPYDRQDNSSNKQSLRDDDGGSQGCLEIYGSEQFYFLCSIIINKYKYLTCYPDLAKIRNMLYIHTFYTKRQVEFI